MLKIKNKFKIKWFSPLLEVDYCGHATIAAAAVIKKLDNIKNIKIESSRHIFELKIMKNNIEIELPLFKCSYLDKNDFTLSQLKNFKILGFSKSSLDLILEIDSLKNLIDFKVDNEKLLNTDKRGLIVTFKNEDNIYFRFFCPKLGYDEDPATGSALSALYPYFFSDNLNIKNIDFIQLSKRGGCSKFLYSKKNKLIFSTVYSKIFKNTILID